MGSLSSHSHSIFNSSRITELQCMMLQWSLIAFGIFVEPDWPLLAVGQLRLGHEFLSGWLGGWCRHYSSCMAWASTYLLQACSVFESAFVWVIEWPPRTGELAGVCSSVEAMILLR